MRGPPDLDELSESGVDPGATARIRQLVGASSEQRVSEPDPVTVKLDHTRFECRDEAVTAPDACCGFHDAHRRL